MNTQISRAFAKALIITGISLVLATGCAGTGGYGFGPDPEADKAIADAKAANKKAKGKGYEWRDAGKMIKKAEKANNGGDSTMAIKLANKAKRQGEIAVHQAGVEQAKFDKTN